MRPRASCQKAVETQAGERGNARQRYWVVNDEGYEEVRSVGLHDRPHDPATPGDVPADASTAGHWPLPKAAPHHGAPAAWRRPLERGTVTDRCPPCPCNSGEKYKFCCGAEGPLIRDRWLGVTRIVTAAAEVADDERITGNLLKSPFRFHRHGQSGLPFSETLPHIARHADRIAIIRSMFTEHRNHEQALRLMHTGMTVVGRPTIGAWAAYGLGTVNQNLPAYIVLPDPGGLPIEGIRNWSSGWMPPVYQGTPFRSGGMPVLDLRPSRPRPETIEEHRLRLLSQLNEAHRQTRPEELELDARIANFEVAAGVSHHVDEVPPPPALKNSLGLSGQK